MKLIMESWRHFLNEAKNKEGKEQGIDGKACWKGYRHAGTEDGKDKCVPMEEEVTAGEEKDIERIKKELDKASQMHKKQSLDLGDIVNEEELEEKKSAAWQRKAGKNKEGGLNKKGRESYERENPGSDLKAPTKKKGNKRRKSFCARMKGMKKKRTSKKTARDPDSRINKSLRKWDC